MSEYNIDYCDGYNQALEDIRYDEIIEMLKKDIDYLEELAMCVPSRFWTEEFRDKWNNEMHLRENFINEINK